MAQVKRAKKRNPARKKLSAKQIKYFGTPAQKAALKRKRSAARKNVPNHQPKHKSSAKQSTGRPAAAVSGNRARRKNPSLPAGFEKARGFKIVRDKFGNPVSVKVLK